MAKQKEEETKKKSEDTNNSGSDAEERKKTLKEYEVTRKESAYSGRYIELKKEAKDQDYIYQGGFYYDSQLEDPYLSISLHANTKIVGGEWVEWPGEHLDSIYKNNAPKWSTCYGKAPIARCIMSEDFSYSIANNFSDYNAGNPIEEIFGNFKPFAPIFGKYGSSLKDATEETKKNKNYGSGIIGAINSAVGKVGDFMSGASSYLNKALFVQGSRFSYYNGTSFNFNNMEMKFVVFSDYVTTDGVTWTFQSVEDYVKTLQPYVMGIYSPYNADFLSKSGIQGEARDFIKEYVGFQDPPGGFEMDTKALNNTLKGTLRMNIGATWAIENLVVRGMNVLMSRVQAKHPEPDHAGETVPLYAEISLQLAPAAAVVDSTYQKILDHGGMDEYRKSLASSYGNRLSKLIEEYTK